MKSSYSENFNKFLLNVRNIFIFLIKWAIPFFIQRGVWKRNSLGLCQKHFPRESGTKIISFIGGQGKFSEGS